LRLVKAAESVALDASAPQVSQHGTASFAVPSAVFPSTVFPAASGYTVNRGLAMSVPAFRQGVNLLAGTCGSFPMRAYKAEFEAVPLPALLMQPDPDEPPSVTWTKVFADLVLNSYAWLYVTERYAPIEKQKIGWPKRAIHLPFEQVTINEARRVMWEQRDITADAIRFDSPSAPGALVDGARILRTSLLIEDAVRRYAAMDIPSGYLKQTGGPELLDSEIDDLLTGWEAARQSRATGFLSQTVDYANTAFDPKALQLVEARAANAVDIARLLNLPPVYVNADAGSSLTYSTTESMGRSLLNTSLVPYLTAVSNRLTMGDITPYGTTVVFNFDSFLRTDLQARAQSYSVLLSAGVLTVDECRAFEALPPLPPDQPDPAPDQTPEDQPTTEVPT
jgi:phage portal protein BeeE